MLTAHNLSHYFGLKSNVLYIANHVLIKKQVEKKSKMSIGMEENLTWGRKTLDVNALLIPRLICINSIKKLMREHSILFYY